MPRPLRALVVLDAISLLLVAFWLLHQFQVLDVRAIPFEETFTVLASAFAIAAVIVIVGFFLARGRGVGLDLEGEAGLVAYASVVWLGICVVGAITWLLFLAWSFATFDPKGAS